VRDEGSDRLVGRIVDVEAYIGTDDRASHARFGPTERNRVMWGPPGIAYVYLVYGMYDCLNVVTEPDGQPAAVLVRAVEPIVGEAQMREYRLRRALARRRALSGPARDAEWARIHALAPGRLANGPGLVAACFDIDRSLTGTDLCDPESPVHLDAPPPSEPPPRVAVGPRVGVAYAGEPWEGLPWRLYVPGHASGPADR
jgi:DNA-3-methyladenine glycosylase